MAGVQQERIARNHSMCADPGSDSVQQARFAWPGANRGTACSCGNHGATIFPDTDIRPT